VGGEGGVEARLQGFELGDSGVGRGERGRRRGVLDDDGVRSGGEGAGGKARLIAREVAEEEDEVGVGERGE
jgi:hypothetical protein